MSQKDNVKPKVEKVNKIGMVVKNLQQTVEDFWDILGIGPWRIFSFGSPILSEQRYYDKPTWYRIKVATVNLGPIDLELIQPVEGNSIYQDWLTKHGEGYHHLRLETENIDQMVELLTKQGFPSIHSGCFGPGNRNRFYFFDIKQLGAIWEVSNRWDCEPSQDVTVYPENPAEESVAKLKVEKIPQVGLVVKDLQRTIEDNWSILGLGPWEIRDWGSEHIPERLYHGRRAWAREKMGHVFIGDLDLEFLQPIEGESIYQDWLDEHGEGIQHLKIIVPDIEEVVKDFTQLGFKNILSMRGRPGLPLEKGQGGNYFYIEPLHSIWEPVHPSKAGRVGIATFYPPELAYDVEKTRYK